MEEPLSQNVCIMGGTSADADKLLLKPKEMEKPTHNDTWIDLYNTNMKIMISMGSAGSPQQNSVVKLEH